MPEKFQKNGWSSKFSCEIVPEFQKKTLLSGRRRHQFKFLAQVNSMFAYSENKSR